MSSISFVCPYCRSAPMKGPEQLCQHMEEYHEASNLMEETEFATGEELEQWLNRIEEGRSEGGVLGSDEEKAEDDTQFYILCHRKSTPQPKRRRLETEDTESSESVISCTAFVHILEKMDGSYHVTYCLEHCGTCDCAESSHEDTRYHKKNNHVQKRSHEDSDDGPSSSSGGSLGSSGQGSLSRRQDAFDLSSMNKFLNHRIDTAANSLKAINQMISEMAMDISNRFWDDAQPPIVPVHYHPNEIYSS